MSDVERLIRRFDAGELLAPTADLPNTVDLAGAIATVCGSDKVQVTAPAREIADDINAEHIVFALIDGLGMNLIEAQPTGAFLRSHTRRELRAVFPSTTATALTSLATGLWPAQHAIPGWWTYLPELAMTATILPFLERFTERPLAELGVDPASVYVAPVLAPLLARDVCSFFPEQIAASVYTSYTTGRTRALGYADLPAAIDSTIERVTSAGGPTYTYIYFPAVDALEHQFGPSSREVRSAMSALDGQLGRLAAGLGDQGRVVISADHGLTTVEKSGKHLVPAAIQELLIVPPSGEPRVPFFHVRAGCEEAFASKFRDHFGARFALLTIDEVEQLELLGPGDLSPLARERIGDFVGIALGRDVLLSVDMEYRGFHGALTPDEMRIPLIIAG